VLGTDVLVNACPAAFKNRKIVFYGIGMNASTEGIAVGSLEYVEGIKEKLGIKAKGRDAIPEGSLQSCPILG